jgi:L-idonate 5-dehydrogenase
VSGNPTSITTCLEVTRARGAMVQVGMGGAVADFPMMMLIAKEIALKGSFRFTTEFNTAVSWLANGVVDPLPLLSGEYPSPSWSRRSNSPAIKPRPPKFNSFFNAS